MTKGQTLIEVLVALAAAVLVVSGLAIAIISALSNAQFSKNQNMATQHAQEAMEHIRKIRDNDWETFQNYGGSYCLDKGSTILRPRYFGDCGQNVDIFTRQIDIDKDAPADCTTPSGDNQAKVTVYVGWSDSKCTNNADLFCHKVKLSTCLSDFTVAPTP